MTGQWFSLGTPVSSTNKTDHHNITEISVTWKIVELLINSEAVNRRTENGQKKDYKTQAIVHKHYTENLKIGQPL